MSVNWLWKNKYGTIELKGNNKFPLTIYRGNCLAVLLCEWEEEGKGLYNFVNFFNDKEHLQKCIGLAKDWEGKKVNLFEDEWEKITLDSSEPYAIKFGMELVKAGFNVEFKKGYCKDDNQNKA